MRKMFIATTLLMLVAAQAGAEPRIEKNVVYGTYSGLALLMDVHYPARPNGYGLVLIPGSGWQTGQGYDAALIKDGGSALFVSLPRLLDVGYTLFVVSHRAAPRFRYPAAVDDVQRAVRFVRFGAAAYGIRADRLGAVGYSSGAHLATLLGVLEGGGEVGDPDPVNRVSAHVQCVVASATPTDLEHFDSGGIAATVSFMGMPPRSGASQDPIAARAYRDASPVSHVSPQSAPLLLLHGDADIVVPFHQAELMIDAAQKVRAEVKLIRVPGGGHVFAQDLSKHPDWPDILGETVRWLDQHLRIGAAQ